MKRSLEWIDLDLCWTTCANSCANRCLPLSVSGEYWPELNTTLFPNVKA